jgi:ABC-type histidine transport system ATPase subunit
MTTQLAIHDLRKSFGAIEVLKGVSLEARAGEVIALIGASGSGKSTLLRCVNLLETPDQGEIAVGGEHIEVSRGRAGATAKHPEKLRAIRAKLGFVFQSFNLWSHMTVTENLIEAPIHVLGLDPEEAANGPRGCWRASACPTRATPTPSSCPADNSSAWPSPARWRWSPR